MSIKHITIFGVVTALISIAALGYFLLQNQDYTPFGATNGEEEIHKEPPPPPPNPAYLEKIRREPFWEDLPYFSDNYKIEYTDSNDLFIITTFLPASNTEVYKQDALTWLQENGADLNELTIEFRRGVE